MRRTMWRVLVWLCVWCCVAGGATAQDQAAVLTVCPDSGIQRRGVQFRPDGLMLTQFDGAALWVYDITRDRRYPLPDTHPCGGNCHLSADALWLTTYNPADNTVIKMRLDGTQRSIIAAAANEAVWWPDDAFLIWTPHHNAYVLAADGTRRPFPARGLISIQPSGGWGVQLHPHADDDGFERVLVNLATVGYAGVAAQQIALGADRSYYNALSWSPDGQTLAFVALVDGSAELMRWRVGDAAPTQWTNLAAEYGSARINGALLDTLSWSPDGTDIAFWVTPLTGPDAQRDTGTARLHILNVASGQVRAYCGYATENHTPNPPRIVWSPTGTHVAFGGDVADDGLGVLLLAMDIDSGALTRLSDGIYPALGAADVLAWGG
jgi:hypothetical protein